MHVAQVHSVIDRLGDLVPQVRARTSPGVFRDMALQGLCLELSFSVLYCRTQANLPTLMHSVMSENQVHCTVLYSQGVVAKLGQYIASFAIIETVVGEANRIIASVCYATLTSLGEVQGVNVQPAQTGHLWEDSIAGERAWWQRPRNYNRTRHC